MFNLIAMIVMALSSDNPAESYPVGYYSDEPSRYEYIVFEGQLLSTEELLKPVNDMLREQNEL